MLVKWMEMASGTVCDGTLRTKFPVPVPVLYTQPIIIALQLTAEGLLLELATA